MQFNADNFVLYFLHHCFHCVGICVLEEQLISQDEDERPSKRGRSDNAVVSTDTLSWIELARYAYLAQAVEQQSVKFRQGISLKLLYTVNTC